MQAVRNSDPEGEALAAVLEAWSDTIGTASATTSDVIDASKQAPPLASAIAAALGEPGEASPHRLAQWLSRHEGRRMQGRWLTSRKGKGGYKRWRVSAGEVGENGEVPTPESGELANNGDGA